MSDKNKTVEYLVFKDGFTVPKEFFESVHKQVLETLPGLLPDNGYTLEKICGPEFWAPLTDGQRRLAGRCMVHMVRNRILPLNFTGPICATPKRYELT
ncbi:MAG: hypothetical protein JSU59_03980 [Nitrospirota bacterium]|nr:MAG: hypothetical protein JSU59_03980 [Nitrospirota bacterium]